MVKNEDYWNKANVPIQKVEAKIVKELDTAVNLYESGELDVQTIDGEYVDEYKDYSRIPYHHLLRDFLHGGKPEGRSSGTSTSARPSR